MFYVDTSVLVAYYCPDPLSETVEAFVTTHDQPVISNLTEVELCSALSRKVREGNMDRNDAGRIAAKFFAHINEGFYYRLLIESQHYKLARDWIRQFNSMLRSLDALHLAAAFLKGLPIITADETMSKSAGMFAVHVLTL